MKCACADTFVDTLDQIVDDIENTFIDISFVYYMYAHRHTRHMQHRLPN